MSSESTPVTRRHIAYLAQHTAREDAFLADLKQGAVAAGIPAIQISPEQASLMQICLKLCGAREVVEVGTLGGYSAVWMARALPDGGRLRTIEIEPKHADFAADWIARSDVPERIEIQRGNALEILPGFETDSADACFIDADKEGYAAYLDECVRIVRPGGLVMVDNAFGFGQLLDEGRSQEVEAIRVFNEKMAARADVQSIIVPLGDGCWIGVVTEPPAAR